MLVGWRSLLFAATAIAAGVAACSSPFSTTVSSSSTGTGAAGAGASTGTTGSGAGDPTCSKDVDCVQPPADGQCTGAAHCVKGTCVTTYELKQARSQIYGDCKQVMCLADGQLQTTDEPSDVYADGNECTDDTCSDAGPLNPPKSGTCGSGSTCVNLGPESTPFCGDCNGPSDCVAPKICQAGRCVPGHCGNANPDALGETDVDCGGECVPCVPGKKCLVNKDCDSHLCTGGIGNRTCAKPACDDSEQNGKETDVGCGGPDCPKCPDPMKCLLPGDCVSGVCKGNICSAPSCTDGIQNGDETSVDCGPSCPPCSH